MRNIFARLTDLPGGARETQLAGMNLAPAIAERLRAMFATEDKPGVLDNRISSTIEDVAPPAYASLAPGTTIGGFRVERLIGRGGMGEVYLAHRDDADFDQRVALKMLRPEAASRFDLFNAERRMLAGLEHPGIARLIDGGVAPDGRPYMALEFVDGQEINDWCAEHNADLATRLHLFLELCSAVGYAHARLVVHRDIKPANILVDERGRARLLDFGIARLLDTSAPDRLMTQAIATPDYAAPEQFDGSPLTVATDIYALGAVLFEMLAGRGPWRFGDEASLPTVLRRLLHEGPSPPSRIADGGAVPASQIAGDLDAIVLKAMRLDPAARYSSIEAFAEDVRRHLEFKPVQARAGAAGYRLRRFLRRNWLPVGAATAVVAALLVGAAGIAWQARKASGERDIARAEAERSEAVNQAMMLMFRDASDSSRVESITARELIDGTAKRLAASLPPESPKSAAVVGALADLYQIVENTTGAQSLLEAAKARGIGRSDPVGAAELKLKLGTILGAQRKFDDARRLLSEADAVWQTDPIRFRRERVETVGAQAYMLRLEGRRDDGIALLIANMPDAERAYADDSRDLATRYANLATHLVEANRFDEADALIGRASSTLARNRQDRSPAGLTLMRLRAIIASRRGDQTTAAAILGQVVRDRRAFYGRSVALAVDLLQYGRVLNQLGRPTDALAALDEAASMSMEYFGGGTQPTLMVGLARADAQISLGRLDAADHAFASVSDGLQKEGPDSLLNCARLVTLASLKFKHGDVRASMAALNGAEAIVRKVGPAAASFEPAIALLRKRISLVPQNRESVPKRPI